MSQSQTISDALGTRLTCSTAMRLLCLAWIFPAVSLVWTGFASIGLRTATTEETVRSLERIQAASVLLAIFGCIVGLMWSLRTLDYLPAIGRIGGGSRGVDGSSHAVAAAASAVAGLAATSDGPFGVGATAVAAATGFYAVLLVARWLLRVPMAPSLPLALLAAGAGFQVTVGWLHIDHPTAMLAPLLVIEGLAMIWAAVAAARVVTATAVAETPVAVDSAAAVLVSQTPTRPSLPGPAVGR